MAFIPSHYALNENFDQSKAINSLNRIEAVIAKAAPDNILEKEMAKSIQIISELKTDIVSNNEGVAKTRKFKIRKFLAIPPVNLFLSTKCPRLVDLQISHLSG